MIKMILEHDISDAAFQNFLDYAFQHSTSFSFTRNRLLAYRMDNPREDAFLARLNPFLQGSFAAKSWFCLTVGSKDSIMVDIFRAAPEAKDILLQYYNDLYLGYRSGKEWLPEDICFFWGDHLWLGTSSHEEICVAFPSKPEIAQGLRAYGMWRTEEIERDFEQLNLSHFIKV